MQFPKTSSQISYKVGSRGNERLRTANLIFTNKQNNAQACSKSDLDACQMSFILRLLY